MVLSHPNHQIRERSDRSLLSILTDPIVHLLRSIPIEILDQSEELSPSQKDFLDDCVRIQADSELGELVSFQLDIPTQSINDEVKEALSDMLNKVEEFELAILQTIPGIIIENIYEESAEVKVQCYQSLLDDFADIYDSGIEFSLEENQDPEEIPAEIDENAIESEAKMQNAERIPAEQTTTEEKPSTALKLTTCAFIRSQSSARCKVVLPDKSFICILPPVAASFSALIVAPKKVVKRRKSTSSAAKMAAEVLQNEPHCFIASSSNIDRPFKLLVQKETFLIDAESMSRISPIFSVMCCGKDFEKMDLSREIVDEKSTDIDCFLRAVHDTSTINSTNFALVLRLSNKYQVDPVIEACQNFIIRQHLDVLRADEILTMLIAAHEHHCKKEVVQKLIKRLASEGNSVFTKLKISRYLPAQVYGSVISTSMNLNQVKEHELMNGHVLKMDRSKIRWRQSVCDECKSVAECANCEECKKTICRNHVCKLKCSSDYGLKLAADLKKKIVDFEWQD